MDQRKCSDFLNTIMSIFLPSQSAISVLAAGFDNDSKLLRAWEAPGPFLDDSMPTAVFQQFRYRLAHSASKETR